VYTADGANQNTRNRNTRPDSNVPAPGGPGGLAPAALGGGGPMPPGGGPIPPGGGGIPAAHTTDKHDRQARQAHGDVNRRDSSTKA